MTDERLALALERLADELEADRTERRRPVEAAQQRRSMLWTILIVVVLIWSIRSLVGEDAIAKAKGDVGARRGGTSS